MNKKTVRSKSTKVEPLNQDDIKSLDLNQEELDAIKFLWQTEGQERKALEESVKVWWPLKYHSYSTARDFLEMAKEEKNPRKAEMYQRLATNMHECHKRMFFDLRPEKPRIVKTFTCKSKFCEPCSRRRAYKIARIVDATIELGLNLDTPEELSLRDCSAIFITMTQRNIPFGQLKRGLDDMTKAWRKFSRRGKFKKAIIGYLRSFEMTINEERREYHPHVHITAFVPRAYVEDAEYVIDEHGTYIKDKNGNFMKDPAYRYIQDESGNYVKDNENGIYIKKGKNKYVKDTRIRYTKKHLYENYISHDELMKAWRDAMGLDYDPWVFVEECYDPKTNGNSAKGANNGTAISSAKLQHAVRETAKYATKIADVKKIKDKQLRHKVMAEMYDALYHRRFVEFCGRLKKIKEALKLDDPENGDLLHALPENRLQIGKAEDYTIVDAIHFPQLNEGKGKGTYVITKDTQALETFLAIERDYEKEREKKEQRKQQHFNSVMKGEKCVPDGCTDCPMREQHGGCPYKRQRK